MANIAKLNVLLSANAGGFVRGINIAKSKITGFQTSISSLSSFMSRTLTRGFFAATAAITATAGALVYLTKKSGDMVDTNAKAARRLGMTYNEFTALNYAAGLAGVTTEQLTIAFEKMEDTLGAAAFGQNGAIKAFEQIGLSVEDLLRMSPERQFRAITEAINNIDNPAERISAVRDIFGRSGNVLINLFEGGSAALDDATQKIQLFGLALSSLQTDAIEYMNDRFSDIKTIIEGIGVQISAYVAPYIGQILDDTINWVVEVGGIPAIMDTIVSKVEDFLSGSDAIVARWMVLSDIVTKIGNALGVINKFSPIKAITDFGSGYIGDLVREKESEIALNRMQNRYNRSTGQSSSGIYNYLQNLPGRAAESAAQREQDRINQPGVEAAKRQRQAEQYYSYLKKFTPDYAAQARMEAQASRHPEWFGGYQGPGRMRSQQEMETIQLLRQIAKNTGYNNLAFAG